MSLSLWPGTGSFVSVLNPRDRWTSRNLSHSPKTLGSDPHSGFWGLRPSNGGLISLGLSQLSVYIILKFFRDFKFSIARVRGFEPLGPRGPDDFKSSAINQTRPNSLIVFQLFTLNLFTLNLAIKAIPIIAHNFSPFDFLYILYFIFLGKSKLKNCLYGNRTHPILWDKVWVERFELPVSSAQRMRLTKLGHTQKNGILLRTCGMPARHLFILGHVSSCRIH